ncbi:MAG: hypothetical protein ABFR90_02640 [Planctomycetota bacterium]
MIGKQERWQEDLFVAGPLSSLVPDDHILKQVDTVLDLSWLRREKLEKLRTVGGASVPRAYAGTATNLTTLRV